MLVRNLFKLIRVVNRTSSRPIWTPTCEDIDHNAKITSFTLPKKKSPHYRKIIDKYFEEIYRDEVRTENRFLAVNKSQEWRKSTTWMKKKIFYLRERAINEFSLRRPVGENPEEEN